MNENPKVFDRDKFKYALRAEFDVYIEDWSPITRNAEPRCILVKFLANSFIDFPQGHQEMLEVIGEILPQVNRDLGVDRSAFLEEVVTAIDGEALYAQDKARRSELEQIRNSLRERLFAINCTEISFDKTG